MQAALRQGAGVLLATLAMGASLNAAAATFNIQAGSAMTDFRRIGVSLASPGTLTSNPLTWDTVDGNMTTNFIQEPFAPVLLGGTIDVTGGVVTAATLIQLTAFQIGTYQSASSQANYVATGIIWTYDAVNNRLVHAAGTFASCVLVNGAASAPGACSASATNNATASDILRFDGMAANQTVTDAVVNPLTGLGGTFAVVNVGGASGHLGITWDLSLFDENSGGGIIKGIAIGDQPSGFAAQFNGGTAAFFTLTTVPVPAAVWLFGSGLALLAGLRRRFPRAA